MQNKIDTIIALAKETLPTFYVKQYSGTNAILISRIENHVVSAKIRLNDTTIKLEIQLNNDRLTIEQGKQLISDTQEIITFFESLKF